MDRFLSTAVLMAGLLVAGVAYAGGATTGTVGTNVGDSMKEPMVVTADNGIVRAKPNATATILTTVPHGQLVTVIGTVNGAWAHILTQSGLDGYIDMVQLAKPAQ
jgi:uncharacterized protein YgiM (DUF1202 family)